MILTVKQLPAGHGFEAGTVHIDTLVSDLSALPRVGDTVTFPAFRAGMEVMKVEFNYNKHYSSFIELDSVVIWVR